MTPKRSIPGALAAVLLFATGATAQGLPGGASALNETHGDWTVTCMVAEEAVQCAMVQTQVSGEARQRVLSIQFAIVDVGGTAEGVLVLPFGLRLDAGVRLAIDENGLLADRRFSTCLPVGCVVPLAFDAGTVAALKAGTSLHVTAMANEGSQEVAFVISLSGFNSAIQRIAQIHP